MPPTWSPPEQHLVTELAVGIARRLTQILAPASDGYEESGYLHHSYTGPFESCCDVLWRLGVAHPTTGSNPESKNPTYRQTPLNEVFPGYFKLFEESEIRAVLTGEKPIHAPSLEDVLYAYVRVACEYGTPGSELPSDRDPLMPSIEYMPEVQALTRLGYIEERDSMLYWTDKMAPVMEAAYFWEPDGQSSHDVEQAAIDKECAAVLAQTPILTRWHLAWKARRLSELDFAILLRDRYDGLYWAKNPDGSLREATNVLLLKRVYKKLRTGS